MKLRALLELCRISNLPTVWSNVAAGYFIGLALYYAELNNSSLAEVDLVESISHMSWKLMLHPLLMIAGISLIYCGGMVLNDYWDRVIDALERPDRPIPSGRVKASTAGSLSIALLSTGFLISGGWLLFALFDNFALFVALIPHLSALILLVSCVVLYNRVHQANATSVLLMGLCRALAFLVPALFYFPYPIVISDQSQWAVFVAAPAATLFFYTFAISIVARREVEPGGPRKFGGPKTIMNMIAAMPLLDAVWLVVMGLWPASLFCVACAGLTKLGHRKVAGS